MSYEAVRERIARAAQRVGRSPDEITLLVVSKGQPVEKVKAIYDRGHRLFGENRVQELLLKKPTLPEDIQWDLIGHLQTNKVKAVLPHIRLLHSLDRESLLSEIGKRAEQPLPCLIEVKIAQEPTKHGVSPETLDAFVEKVLSEPKVILRGLMGMATWTSEEQQIRKEFRLLYQLFDKLRRQYPDLPIDTLSMGMSNDFEIAVEEGSTLVRVGSAVFSE
ncbi:MAG: YggS family pyridoxal phosphate-dependent enzyme [Bacteroidia bacterium]|nr:YggS family pyridoxal phosphate-dependent enzyme [Bacteroidia bacterium]MCX7764165.1 YggS family pyridoxal phosphate-dependent enzyme [Bacteroidia bacterium]MDW8057660.1 YggS family pyridoxal phosphate-dependent enzyme [Bacteroidia bacterium]